MSIFFDLVGRRNFLIFFLLAPAANSDTICDLGENSKRCKQGKDKHTGSTWRFTASVKDWIYIKNEKISSETSYKNYKFSINWQNEKKSTQDVVFFYLHLPKLNQSTKCNLRIQFSTNSINDHFQTFKIIPQFNTFNEDRAAEKLQTKLNFTDNGYLEIVSDKIDLNKSAISIEGILKIKRGAISELKKISLEDVFIDLYGKGNVGTTLYDFSMFGAEVSRENQDILDYKVIDPTETNLETLQKELKSGISSKKYSVIELVSAKYNKLIGSGTKEFNSKKFTKIVHHGHRDNCKIIARFNDDEEKQNEIEPFFTKRPSEVSGVTSIVRNARYAFHPEAGNSYFRKNVKYQDIVAVHEGADKWSSPSAIGMGQEDDEHFKIVNCDAYGKQGIGFHNNVDWEFGASLEVIDSSFTSYDKYGSAISCSSIGAGVMSHAIFRNCSINGIVKVSGILNRSSLLKNHLSNRIEYYLTFDNCSPFIYEVRNKTKTLVLSALNKELSEINVSGGAADALFGRCPHIQMADISSHKWNAQIWSNLAIECNQEDTNPGVSIGERLKRLQLKKRNFNILFENEDFKLDLRNINLDLSNEALVKEFNKLVPETIEFLVDNPYEKISPIYQRNRENNFLNVGKKGIDYGEPVAREGNNCRLMESTDPYWKFCGFSLTQTPSYKVGNPYRQDFYTRCLFSGYIHLNQISISVDKSEISVGDKLEVNKNGKLHVGNENPIAIYIGDNIVKILDF